MIKAVAKYFSEIPSAFIDGLLYVGIGWFAFSQTFLGGDEAAKWIAPAVKFWLNYIIGSLTIVATNLKSYRSTGFADHQRKKEENTRIFIKPPDGQ